MKDEEAKVFIKKLIDKASTRPSAGELLHDPFLTTIRPSDKEIIVINKKVFSKNRVDFVERDR